MQAIFSIETMSADGRENEQHNRWMMHVTILKMALLVIKGIDKLKVFGLNNKNCVS